MGDLRLRMGVLGYPAAGTTQSSTKAGGSSFGGSLVLSGGNVTMSDCA